MHKRFKSHLLHDSKPFFIHCAERALCICHPSGPSSSTSSLTETPVSIPEATLFFVKFPATQRTTVSVFLVQVIFGFMELKKKGL